MKKTIIILGLGNPGGQYEDTRHNFGFLAVDKFADIHNIEIKQRKGSYLFGTGSFKNKNGEKVEVILAKPICFMNRSGVAAKGVLNQFELDPDSILIIYDDIGLPLGKVRIRRRGSSGGHRGIDSIIGKLETREFPRLKLGIGEQPKGKASEDFVLEDFTKRELKIVADILEQVPTIIEDFSVFGIEKLMHKYNGRVVTHLQPGEEL